MTHGSMPRHLAVLLLATVAGGAWSTSMTSAAPAPAPTAPTSVVPVPVSVTPTPGVAYQLGPATSIRTETGSAAAGQVGGYLAGILRPSTGYALPLGEATGTAPADSITLLLSGAGSTVGAEGYTMDVTASGVVIRANQAAGLFAGVQTLRQLLPAAVEAGTVQPGPWPVAGGHIVDYPRFAHRGAMLDVSRHFFTVEQVRRYIDQIAMYKLNRLHLHLSDDQGWRIVVNSWPNLAVHGGSTQVGGGPGGYYSQDDYRAIVAHAQQRHITVIPEIDMPGHTNAALSSYPELTCDGVAPPLYTGTDVGFSTLCVGKEITYTFVGDVMRELAALTPGPYLHIGGDEAHSTTPADYTTFVDRAQQIVTAQGKTMMGWHDVVNAHERPDTVAQFWGTTTSHAGLAAAVATGTRVVMSPANRSYLDMKYNRRTVLGQTWAGTIDVRTAYGWDPGNYLTGVPEVAVLGVEAPLWTETIVTSADIEYMAFPRLPAIAELGWSPWSTHDWTAFRDRLGAQGPRWNTMGINYYRSTQISWPAGS